MDGFVSGAWRAAAVDVEKDSGLPTGKNQAIGRPSRVTQVMFPYGPNYCT